MTVLDELIQELCPEGVAYKTLGEIATDVFRGAGITRDQVRETGTPCVRYGEIYTTYGVWFEDCVSHTDETLLTSKKYFGYGDILFAITGESVEDIAKCCAYIGHETCLAGGDIVVLKHNEDPKYLSYALSTLDAQKQKSKGKVKSKVVHSSVPDIKAIRIPVPPLPVQREIVRILDNFTEITQKLTTELAAELIARKQQYEYYRNRLLAFDVRGGGTSRTEWRMFGETCFLQAGKAIDAESISKEKTLEYCIPCYGGNGLRGYVRKANQKGEKPLVGRQGALCGNVCFAKGDYYATEHAVVVTDRGFYNSRFLYHLLVNKNLNQYKTAGAQPGLSVTKLETILLPVPETEIQNRIADVLDNFDAICTDLSSGLPAEIEARQKQYEYYRDKLLSFEEKI